MTGIIVLATFALIYITTYFIYKGTYKVALRVLPRWVTPVKGSDFDAELAAWTSTPENSRVLESSNR
jgi:hypothetical protein